MSKILLCGDIHGKVEDYLNLIRPLNGQRSIQLGDFGFGFRDIPALPEETKFIRGNHDDPAKARAHKNYLGDFGYLPEDKLFYLGGAYSIDRNFRIENVSWWKDEELSFDDLNAACHLYMDSKPEIVITHEAPTEVVAAVLKYLGLIGAGRDYKSPCAESRTSRMLQHMFEIWQPTYWIFGHYHTNWRSVPNQFGRTTFQCLNELATCELNTGD